MTEEELPDEATDASTTPTDSKKVTFTVDVPTDDGVVVCAVCGHENPPRAALCALCSNYLR